MASPAAASRMAIKTFNKLNAAGLARFDPAIFRIAESSETNAHAILLRSHKLTESDVPIMCRSIARCGAGTNNCNVGRMTELGVPVFNTPGANANAVKELVLCALFMSSRGVIEGAFHMDGLHAEGTAHERIEKDKALFGGREIAGKTLGVVGLGAIGAAVLKAALGFGMDVVGYDPSLSVEGALRLPGRKMKMVDTLDELAAVSDYVTLHAPYNDHTKGLVGSEFLGHMKRDACLLNFARGELVDEAALAAFFDSGATGRYVCDFAVGPELSKRPNVITIPHLGASTDEAEENAAAMAADTTSLFLQTGSIRDSVNFPTTTLPVRDDTVMRVCLVNENRPGMLGDILSVFGNSGINITQQMNTSRGDVAYNVIDIERLENFEDVHFKSWDALQFLLTSMDGVKSTRYIHGSKQSAKHSGFAVNFNGQVFGIGSNYTPSLPSFGELNEIMGPHEREA
jgi:D-3-phosphoglycerate dehydrogenase